MNDPSNRTFVCSVLFLDIVEYSKKPVTEQLSLKQRFNELLIGAMVHVATADRIVLDTGDGAAVSFLGNPEDCLFAAIALRDAIAAENPELSPKMLVRIGINLGPVRLIRDINGQLNIIGDGINVAQRVMSFADPGVILVSRSYFDVVSCLSTDFAQLFQYDGTRTDKHVREHSVYAVGRSRVQMPAPVAVASVALSSASEPSPPGAPLAPDVTAAPPASTTSVTPPRMGGKNGQRNLILASVAAVILIGGAVALRVDRSAPDAAVPPAPTSQPAPATSTPPLAANRASPAAGNATLNLAITPWGEVKLDGKSVGVSPPLKTLALPPGSHRIEISNTGFPPHVVTLDGGGGKELRIQHNFGSP